MMITFISNCPNVSEMIKNKIILLIEDDIEVGNRLIKQISNLSNVGSLHWKKQLKESYLFLHETEPDIIILDLKLPDGIGIELLKKVKKKKTDIRVFIFSINSELKNICLRNGADQFFDKKDGTEKLLKVLDAL